MTEKGKISGKPKDLETVNLVDIYNARHYFTAPSREWEDDSLPKKKGDLGRPIIPIVIGAHTFEEAVCDLGASVNIMPRVIYEKIHGEPLLYTTMYLQLADQTLCYPKGILEDVYIRVGHFGVLVDFVVIETEGDERAPIILGRPFLSIAKAIIYEDSAKIYFTINDRKEWFSFKRRTLKAPVHPQTPYIYAEPTAVLLVLVLVDHIVLLDMTLFLINYIFLVIMIIVYFDYISSIVKLYLYSSTCSYSAHSCDQRVSGRHCVNVVLIHYLPADAPYILRHQVVDRGCNIPVESFIVHSLNIGLVRPGFKARLRSVLNSP
jgi:hypothetical protein